jgi:hypothetical protein
MKGTVIAAIEGHTYSPRRRQDVPNIIFILLISTTFFGLKHHDSIFRLKLKAKPFQFLILDYYYATLSI